LNPHVPCGTAVFKTAAIPLGEPSNKTPQPTQNNSLPQHPLSPPSGRGALNRRIGSLQKCTKNQSAIQAKDDLPGIPLPLIRPRERSGVQPPPKKPGRECSLLSFEVRRNHFHEFLELPPVSLKIEEFRSHRPVPLVIDGR
jgi:hypothetical protein